MLRFYREPLLPQQVTSSKPCKDDSITPLKSLQEIKMKFFNHPFLFGTIKGLSQSMSCREACNGRKRASVAFPRPGLCPN
jgi:hypothetical protein